MPSFSHGKNMPIRKRRMIRDELRWVGENEEGRGNRITGKKRKRESSRDQKCHVTGRDGESGDCVHAGWGGQTDSPGILRASAPSRKYLGIRAPLQGAGPRKGFVARQGRPEARRASAGASTEAYKSVRRTSERRARPTQPGDRLSQQKRQPFWRPAPAARSAPPALCRTPCARLGVPEVRLRRARSSFAV